MDHGIRVSRKQVERLMRKAEIGGWCRASLENDDQVPGSGLPVTCSCVISRPARTRVWVADITTKTWEGWIYLAAIQDLFSRRIVGWSMADHMRAELVVDALEMAFTEETRPGSDSSLPIRAANTFPSRSVK